MAIIIPNQGLTLDWSAASTWKGAVVPASNDIVVFEEGGTYVFTAGLNQASVNLAALVALNCFLTIAGQLQIDVNNSGRGLVLALRGGDFRISGVTNVVSVERQGAQVSLEGGAHALIVAVNGGPVVIGSGATAEDVKVFRRGVVRAESHATDRLKVDIGSGGICETRRNVETGNVGHGRLELIDSARITDGSTGGQVDLRDGRAELRIRANQALTHRRINAWAGVVDATPSTGVQTYTNDVETPDSMYLDEAIGGRVVRSGTTRYGFSGSAINRTQGVE